MVFQARLDYVGTDETAKLFRQSCREGDLARAKELLFHETTTAASQSLGLRDAIANSHTKVIRFLLEGNVVIDGPVVNEARSISNA